MVKQFKVITTVLVDSKRVVDLFMSACEGGSNYWCAQLTPLEDHDSLDAYEAMLYGFILIDGESGLTHTVIETDIQTALNLMAEKYPRHFNEFINDQDDAITSDVFLQLCVFKDLIYG